MNRRLMTIVALSLFVVAGCNALDSIPTQADVQKLRDQAATQPAGSATQQALTAQADKAQTTVNTINAIPAAGGLLGPYGAMAGYALLGGLTLYKHLQGKSKEQIAEVATTAVQEIVQGIDIAGGLTAAQKAIADKIQSPSTQAAVAAVRAPSTPDVPPAVAAKADVPK